MVIIKFDVQLGRKYISCKCSVVFNYFDDFFQQVYCYFKDLMLEQFNDLQWFKDNKFYVGEFFLGYLCYGIYSNNGVEICYFFLC